MFLVGGTAGTTCQQHPRTSSLIRGQNILHIGAFGWFFQLAGIQAIALISPRRRFALRILIPVRIGAREQWIIP